MWLLNQRIFPLAIEVSNFHQKPRQPFDAGLILMSLVSMTETACQFFLALALV
jgi:hypothetical protein